MGFHLPGRGRCTPGGGNERSQSAIRTATMGIGRGDHKSGAGCCEWEEDLSQSSRGTSSQLIRRRQGSMIDGVKFRWRRILLNRGVARMLMGRYVYVGKLRKREDIVGLGRRKCWASNVVAPAEPV